MSPLTAKPLSLRVTFSLIVCMSITLIGCESNDSDQGKVRGSGVAKTETRTVKSFDSILLAGGATLKISVGRSGPLKITADDNILPYLETTATDGRLTIKPDTPIKPKTTIAIEAVTDALEGVACHGAGNIEVFGVDSQTFSIEINGAGNVYAEGKTNRLSVTAEGAATIDLTKLLTKNAFVTLRGAGSAEVHADEALDATIEGVGRIEYYGDATVTKNIKGLGRISKGG